MGIMRGVLALYRCPSSRDIYSKYSTLYFGNRYHAPADFTWPYPPTPCSFPTYSTPPSPLPNRDAENIVLSPTPWVKSRPRLLISNVNLSSDHWLRLLCTLDMYIEDVQIAQSHSLNIILTMTTIFFRGTSYNTRKRLFRI